MQNNILRLEQPKIGNDLIIIRIRNALKTFTSIVIKNERIKPQESLTLDKVNNFLEFACLNLYRGLNIKDVIELNHLEIFYFIDAEQWGKFFLQNKYEYDDLTRLAKNNHKNILNLLIFLKNVCESAIIAVKKSIRNSDEYTITTSQLGEVLNYLQYFNWHLDILVQDLGFKWKKDAENFYCLVPIELDFLLENENEKVIIKDQHDWVIKMKATFSPTMNYLELRDTLRVLSVELEKIRPKLKKIDNRFERSGGLYERLNKLNIRHSKEWEKIKQIYPEIKDEKGYFLYLRETRDMALNAYLSALYS